MEFYRTDPSVKHIKPYVDIIAGSPVYPVIYDAKRTVLSLPPIINGEHSKVREAALAPAAQQSLRRGRGCGARRGMVITTTTTLHHRDDHRSPPS